MADITVAAGVVSSTCGKLGLEPQTAEPVVGDKFHAFRGQLCRGDSASGGIDGHSMGSVDRWD